MVTLGKFDLSKDARYFRNCKQPHDLEIIMKKSKSTESIKWYESLDKEAIKTAFEDATVDAYGDDEQHTGLFHVIAEDIEFPFQGSVLGDEVTVVRAEMPDSDRLGIDFVVEKNGKQSRIECRSVELLPPFPEGHLYLAAYLWWKERI